MTRKMLSIVLGGVVAGILGDAFSVAQFHSESQFIGIIGCCMTPTAGGLVAIWHYTASSGLAIKAGEGAVIGVAACTLGYLVSILVAILVSTTGIAPGPFDLDAIVALMRQKMETQGADASQIDSAVDMTRRFFFVTPVVALLGYSLFGAVVGAIGALIFDKGGDKGEAPDD